MTTPPERRRALRLNAPPSLGPALMALTMILAVAGLSACGSTSDGSTDNTAAVVSDATTAPAPTADTTDTTDTTKATRNPTTAATATTAEPGPTLIEATVAAGTVDAASERFPVALGDEVSIVVQTDVAEHVHLHGYDIEVDVAPGAPGVIDFVADVPGVFEVELESSGTFLFEIEVS